jgi:organic hydroperoxide reductase OsmC/OhrA
MTSFKNTIRCTAGGTATTTMSGVRQAEIGAPVEYGGRADTLNPEELFVASINSCLMLVFYHFAGKSGLEIESYEADAEGTVEKTRNGLRFTDVHVQARVRASGAEVIAKLGEVAELADKYCLISNSVNFPVRYSVSLVEGGS